MDGLAIFGFFLLLGGALLWAVFIALSGRASGRSPLPGGSPAPPHPLADPEALILIDAAGRIVRTNAAARRWFTATRGPLTAESLIRQCTPADDLAPLIHREGQAVIRAGSRLYRVQSRLAGSNGRSRVEIRFSPIPALPGWMRSPQGVTSARFDTAFMGGDTATVAYSLLAGLLPSAGADWAMITLWDPSLRKLVPKGSAAAVALDPALNLMPSEIPLHTGVSGRLAQDRQATVIADLDRETGSASHAGRARPHFRSFLGFPLELAGELIGTLEFYSLAPKAFSADLLQNLQPAVPFAAIAIQNTLVHTDQKERNAEVRALAEMSAALDSAPDSNDFFDRLEKAVLPLVDARFLGFFLYDGPTQTILPQRPFHGIPDHLLEKFAIPVPAGSRAHARWKSMDPFWASGAELETLFRELQIHPLARALELTDAAFLPISATEETSGWMMAAGKPGGPLGAEDIRRLLPLATQAGRLIKTHLLFQSDRKRLQQAEAVRRMTAVAAVPVPYRTFLKTLLIEVSVTLEADQVAFFLFDEARGRISLQAESAVGIPHTDLERFAVFSAGDPSSRSAACIAQKTVLANAATTSPSLAAHYRPWVDYFSLENLLVVPVSIRGKGAGEILVGRRKPGFQGHEQEFLEAAAAIAGGNLEREQLLSATDVSLRHRVEQLTALTRIARELNARIDLPSLVRMVYEEAIRILAADCGRIVLLDPDREARPLRPLLLMGDPAPGGTLTELERAVLESGAPRILRDAPAHGEILHGGMRSALLVPIVHRGTAVGLLYLHAANPNWFDEESMEIAETLCVQLAMAISNAQRFEEQEQASHSLRQRSLLLATIRQTGRAALAEGSLAKRLAGIAESVQNILGLTPVAIGAFRGETIEWEATTGLAEGHGLALREMILQRDTVERWIAAATAQDGAFPLPDETDDLDARQFQTAFKEKSITRRILLYPLHSPGGELTGVLAGGIVSESHPGPDLTFLEIFASQAALAIQVDLLQQTLLAQKSAAAGPAPAPARFLETGGLETADVHSLRLRLHRLLAMVQVTETLSTQAEPTALLEAFSRKMLESNEADTVVIAAEEAGGPKLRLVVGNSPGESQIEMLLGQHNPIPGVLQRGEPLLVPSLSETGNWVNSPLLAALQASSFVCFPIRSRKRTSAAVLLVSQAGSTPFLPGDEDLFQLLGEQVAIYLENSRLMEETRRRLREGNVLLEFSRQVAALDLPLILQTLVGGTRNAIPEAEGAMVALWDAEKSLLGVQASDGYANGQRLRQIACLPDEGLLGKTYAAARAVHWPKVDMGVDFTLRQPNLEAYRDGAMGLVPASALGIPLQAGDKLHGVLLLENFTVSDAFSTNSEEVALSLANQAALAIEKARIFQEMMNRTRELDQRASHLALLNRLSNAAITTSNELTLLQIACREIAAAFDVPQASAWLLQPAGKAGVVAEYLYPGRPSAFASKISIADVPAVNTILQTRVPMQVESLAEDPRLGEWHEWLLKRQTTSLLLLPILVASEAAGFFLIESPEVHSFSLADLTLAQTVSAQLGQALENVRLHQSARRLTTDLEHRVVERSTALEREHRRAETLLRISTELVATLDLEQVIHRALQLVNEAIGADQASIVLLNSDSQQLVYRASLDAEGALPPGGRALPFHVGEGLAGWVIQHRQSVILPDINRDPRWVHLYPEEPPRYRSALAVPLIVGSDALGALLLMSQDPSVFNPEQLRLASAAANQVAAAINNAELYRLIRDQADRLGELVRSQQVESRKSRAMLEAIADGVMVTDDQHKIVLFNDAAERILGLNRNRLLGRPAAGFSGLVGKAGREWQTSLNRWRENPAAISGGEYLAERIALEDGKVLSVHIAPISSGDEYIGSVSVFRDITRDVEVDRLKSEFVATVSHELRTPMTAIKGYVEILLLGAAGEISDPQRQFLQVVRENTDRLETLVADLLDVSRMEAGQIRLNIDIVEIPQLLGEAADRLRERCRSEHKPLTVQVEAPPDLPAIHADRARIAEIVANLAENAFLYTPEGGTVTLAVRSAEEGVQIDVTDTGIGITAAEQERLFERFFRGENPLVMASPGTGLGLAITKRLVEMHRGRIWVESAGRPGEGSSFHVFLPREAVKS